MKTEIGELSRMSNAERALWVARHPLRALERAGRKLVFPALVRAKSGLTLGPGCDLKGLPHVEIHPGATIRIGRNVTLNSWNANYHLNMHSPVKLIASLPGATIEIGDDSRIHGTCLHACRSIRVGKNCLIAANTQIFDSSGHDPSFPDVEKRLTTRDVPRAIEIGDNVWIGANVIILPGVTIGAGSIVAAGSVVVKEVPPFVVVGGNPARILRDYRELAGVRPSDGAKAE